VWLQLDISEAATKLQEHPCTIVDTHTILYRKSTTLSNICINCSAACKLMGIPFGGQTDTKLNLQLVRCSIVFCSAVCASIFELAIAAFFQLYSGDVILPRLPSAFILFCCTSFYYINFNEN